MRILSSRSHRVHRFLGGARRPAGESQARQKAQTTRVSWATHSGRAGGARLSRTSPQARSASAAPRLPARAARPPLLEQAGRLAASPKVWGRSLDAVHHGLLRAVQSEPTLGRKGRASAASRAFRPRPPLVLCARLVADLRLCRLVTRGRYDFLGRDQDTAEAGDGECAGPGTLQSSRPLVPRRAGPAAVGRQRGGRLVLRSGDQIQVLSSALALDRGVQV